MDFNKSVIERSKTTPVVVQFTAQWCGHCKPMKAMIGSQSVARGDFDFYLADVDVNKELVKTYGVRGIPKVVLFKNGSVVSSFMAGASPQAFTNWLNQFIQKKEAEKSAS
jgi:putative thioredoxin